MKYETLYEETRVLPKGSLALRFVRRWRWKQQTQWSSGDVERLSDLSLQYFKKHGIEDSGCVSYWVDVHGGGLAVRVEAVRTKLRSNRVVQYRMLLRRFAGRDARLRNERSIPRTHSLPRGLLRSLDKSYRAVPDEETSEFYVPLIPVRFVSVPSTFHLSLDMSPEKRQRISRQLPENCSVKVPLSPFPATKIEAAGTGERFIGLLSDEEESVAFYMTMDKANCRTVKSAKPFIVYPPLAMRYIIENVNRPVLQKHFNEGICRTSVSEESILRLGFKWDELFSLAKGQTRTSSKAFVPRTPPGSPPRIETKVFQNRKRSYKTSEFKGLEHFLAYFGFAISTTANPSRAFEPTSPISHKLSFGKESEIESYRPLLLSEDFASHSGKIWILSYGEESNQDATVAAKFYIALPVYSSSVKVSFVYFTSTFLLSFEDLTSIKSILTLESFPMTLTLSNRMIDYKFTQINTLVHSIVYILFFSNAGSKVPLSPEERRIWGYKSTDLLKSIEYYTVHPPTALTWASIFYHEIRLSSFRCGKTKIAETLTSFQSLIHACYSCTRNQFPSGSATDESYRNDKMLNALCPSSNQRIGLVPPTLKERFVVVKLPYKDRLGMKARCGTGPAPTDYLQKTPYWVNSRLPIQRFRPAPDSKHKPSATATVHP